MVAASETGKPGLAVAEATQGADAGERSGSRGGRRGGRGGRGDRGERPDRNGRDREDSSGGSVAVAPHGVLSLGDGSATVASSAASDETRLQSNGEQTAPRPQVGDESGRDGRRRGRGRQRRDSEGTTFGADADTMADPSPVADAAPHALVRTEAHEDHKPDASVAKPSDTSAQLPEPQVLGSGAQAPQQSEVGASATKIAAKAAEPVAPAPLPVFELPTQSLHTLAQAAGLEWVQSDAEKVSAAQAALAAQPKPIHVPRERVVRVLEDEGPLVLVETRKDLSQVRLPFEQSTGVPN